MIAFCKWLWACILASLFVVYKLKILTFYICFLSWVSLWNKLFFADTVFKSNLDEKMIENKAFVTKGVFSHLWAMSNLATGQWPCSTLLSLSLLHLGYESDGHLKNPNHLVGQWLTTRPTEGFFCFYVVHILDSCFYRKAVLLAMLPINRSLTGLSNRSIICAELTLELSYKADTTYHVFPLLSFKLTFSL